MLGIEVVVLEEPAVTSSKRRTFGTPDKGNVTVLSLPLLVDIIAFREIIFEITLVDDG